MLYVECNKNVSCCHYSKNYNLSIWRSNACEDSSYGFQYKIITYWDWFWSLFSAQILWLILILLMSAPSSLVFKRSVISVVWYIVIMVLKCRSFNYLEYFGRFFDSGIMIGYHFLTSMGVSSDCFTAHR